MTEAKVIGIFGGEQPTPAGEPSQEVIDLLEEVLAQAKSGRLRAVGIAKVMVDHWYSAASACDGPYAAALIGASAVLTRRLTD